MDARWLLRRETTSKQVPAVAARLPVERLQEHSLGLLLVVLLLGLRSALRPGLLAKANRLRRSQEPCSSFD
jgi:hypothetical protein